MKRILSALAALFILVAPFASAKDNYVSDELFTYMHSGPGTQYRIIGSVNAGTKITLIKESGGYTQIIDNRDRKGWIETKYVSSVPSLKIRLPQLEAELAQAKTSLEKEKKDATTKHQDLISALAKRTARVKELEVHTDKLNQKLIKSQAEIRELSARIDTQKDDLLMKYFTYGGIVAGGGLLFGLLLPLIIPRRKKNLSGWA